MVGIDARRQVGVDGIACGGVVTHSGQFAAGEILFPTSRSLGLTSNYSAARASSTALRPSRQPGRKRGECEQALMVQRETNCRSA